MVELIWILNVGHDLGFNYLQTSADDICHTSREKLNKHLKVVLFIKVYNKRIITLISVISPCFQQISCKKRIIFSVVYFA